jgi:hypothetical protein
VVKPSAKESQTIGVDLISLAHRLGLCQHVVRRWGHYGWLGTGVFKTHPSRGGRLLVRLDALDEVEARMRELAAAKARHLQKRLAMYAGGAAG